MIIIYGDYMDMNFHQPYEWGKPDNVSQKEADKLRPYWDKFINNNLLLQKKKPTREEWEANVWINVTNSWFTKNGYTTYDILKPSSRPSNSTMLDRKAKWYIDLPNRIVITEWFDSRHEPAPKTLDKYKDRMVEYCIKEYKRMTGYDFGSKKLNSQIAEDYANAIKKWCNKVTTKWFHD